MYVTPRIEVFQYDGTNSSTLLTMLSSHSGYTGGTWSIEEENTEGVIFKIFYEEYDFWVMPKLSAGDYLVVNPRNGAVDPVAEDKLLDWYVVVAE